MEEFTNNYLNGEGKKPARSDLKPSTEFQTLKKTMPKQPAKTPEMLIKPASIDYNFIRQQQGKSNSEAITAEYHGQKWDAKNGGKIHLAQTNSSRTGEAADKAEHEYEQAKSKLDNIYRYDIGSEAYGDDGNPIKGKSTPYSEWPRYQLVMMIGLAIACFALLGLGAINIAVLILSSGIPAFLENPALAYLLGAIVPSIAMAVKSGYHLCNLDRHKHNYAWSVFVIAGALALAWVILFASTFDGNTSEIIWDDIGESAGGNTFLHTIRNITQILVEIFVGAALFLVIDRTHNKFSAQSITEKTGWRELKEQVDELKQTHEVLRETHHGHAATQKQLEAARAAFTLEAVGYLSD